MIKIYNLEKMSVMLNKHKSASWSNKWCCSGASKNIVFSLNWKWGTSHTRTRWPE